ncbi:uncharacterized protein LOC132755523 [Ruditapes philippinarum]|uniref:uncharacterized protein LOC132755523 n=1 Tax=Ruditapes philippinarum TaxID=129788 RepID=UPI00295A6FB3|nr:uncharacterized protein LOC132755523 [Ruditapes philippinarum]
MNPEERLKNISQSDIRKAFDKTCEDIGLTETKLELVTEDRYPEVLEILRDCFINDEPLEKSLQLQWSSEMAGVWLNALQHNMSILLVNNENNEIIGVRVIRVTRKTDQFEKDKCKDEQVLKLLNFFDYTTDTFDFFRKYNVSEIFEFFGLGVVSKYRRRGYGTLLMEAGVKLINNLEIKPCFIRGSASSNFAKTIFEKCEFETVADFPYCDYNVEDCIVFDDTGEHKSMTVYSKCLE